MLYDCRKGAGAATGGASKAAGAPVGVVDSRWVVSAKAGDPADLPALQHQHVNDALLPH